MPAMKEWADKVKEIQTELKATLKVAQKRQAEAYDRKHKAAPLFEPGEKVWLPGFSIIQSPPIRLID